MHGHQRHGHFVSRTTRPPRPIRACGTAARDRREARDVAGAARVDPESIYPSLTPTRKEYDARKLIMAIADTGSINEYKAEYASR